MNINPEFPNLDPEGIKAHFAEKQMVFSSEFPIDVFPDAVVNIIEETHSALGFPKDFIAASILGASAIAIGNSCKIRLKLGFELTAVLYITLIGRPGTNKSHPLTFALRPISQRDAQNNQKYKLEKQEYDRIAALPKQEKEELGITQGKKPRLEQMLLTDFTPEALLEVHGFNPRGIAVYADELAAWVNNFNRYHGGSEEQFWLSAWSCTPIAVNRKQGEPLRIEMPFIPVIGTIQPALLHQLAANRKDTGFLDRILFVYPDNLRKTPWTEGSLSPDVFYQWAAIMNNLLWLPMPTNSEYNPEPEVLEFTLSARKKLYDWQAELTALSNDPEQEAMSGFYAKMETMAIRFCLILQLLRYATKQSGKEKIEIESVEGAIKLAGYFLHNARKVHDIINNPDLLEKLSELQFQLYEALPDTFTTQEGRVIAKKLGMPPRTFSRFLANRNYFRQLNRGSYTKIF